MKPLHAFLIAFALTGFVLVGGPETLAALPAASAGLGPIALPTI